MEDAYFRTGKEVLEFFGTDPHAGLTTEQAKRNYIKYGPNELLPTPKTSWISLVIKQFQELLVLILLGAAVTSFILSWLEEGKSYLETIIEPAVILLILICNAVVGVWQESSAEEAIEKLKEFEAKTAVIIRDGEIQRVDRSILVPGDLVVLSVGEKVPADCRMLDMQSRTVKCDQSMLTGEPHAIIKSIECVAQPKGKTELVDQDKHCILFAGTLVVHGRCRAIAVLTAEKTSMGKIQKGLMEQSEHKTPLGEKLDEFAALLSKIISGICIIVWLINLNHFSEHGSWLRGAMYYLKIAVALAVAAIPEGLPAVVTTCLALGTRRMAKKKAIVKSLPSVETLGCTTVICSDKTGTLTTNQMSVRKVMTIESAAKNAIDTHYYQITGTTYNPKGDVIDTRISNKEDAKLLYPCEKPSLRWISKISCLCNDANITYDVKEDGNIHWHVTGEPTEGALKVLAEKLHLPDAEEAARLAREQDTTRTCNAVHTYWNTHMRREHVLEFTRDRKSMSVFVRQLATNNGWLLVKGAPESLLERSTHIFVNGTSSTLPINEIHKNEIERVYHEFASEGLRCLGIAFKAFEQEKFQVDTEDYSRIETDLTFVGVIGMLDPPRLEVKKAIQICNQAGIRVIVITGDNKKTAEEICREIGLFGPNEDLHDKSFTGGDFMALTEAQQHEAVRRATLFSRVMPMHKQHLVDLLQQHKEVVAMTGDGVNDAPALKKADIGIGMGTGTEVARHASHMILSDDNFATIVSAVEEGRAIYANTKQFIRYLISSNIGEVVCIFLTAALGFPEALIPVQLLWVNLVTDGLPATALGFNKPDRDIMSLPPRGRTEKIINGWMFFRYFLIGTYVGAATILGFYWWFCWYGAGPQVTFGQLTHFYACNQSTETHKLYFSNWKGDCSVFRDFRPCTISLSILVTIEMFNTFNALSENQSLLVTPPWANIYVVFAVTLSMLLHIMILYVPFFRTMFSTAALNATEWLAVVIISFPVVILDEMLKFISRQKDAKASRLSKKEI